MPKNIIIALQAVKPCRVCMLRARRTSSWKLFEFSENFTQLKCGASSLQVLDKFSQNFANGFLKSKNQKGGGYFQIPKIFGNLNFELPKNKCSWHCSRSPLAPQSASAV